MHQVVTPWKNINWQHTIAECDRDILTEEYCRDKGIDLNDLPEPYCGNIDSNVVCLNLNPGLNKCGACFYGNQRFLELTKATLDHRIDHSMWFDEIKCEKGINHDGCNWWMKRTRKLRESLKVEKLNIFTIEFFPYHTKHAFKFPELPSNEYRNYLLAQAIEDNKLIVIMRGKNRWYNIEDGGLREKLRNHKNKIEMSNPRNVAFSEKTIGAKWDLLISSLRKDVVNKHRYLR